MAMSAEHRSKFAAHDRPWWRLHISEEFSSGTKQTNKQTKTKLLNYQEDVSVTCLPLLAKSVYSEIEVHFFTFFFSSNPYTLFKYISDGFSRWTSIGVYQPWALCQYYLIKKFLMIWGFFLMSFKEKHLVFRTSKAKQH